VVGSQWLLVLLLLALYYQIEDAPYWAHALRALFRDVDAAFFSFHLAAITGIFLVLAIPIGLSGALLPLLFHLLRGEIRDLGSVAGRLYSWNTIGSLFGALFGGYVLFFWLDLHQIYRIALAALIIGSTLLTVIVFRIPKLAVAALVLLPALVAVWMLPAWAPERLGSGMFRSREPTLTSFMGPDAFFPDNLEHRFIFHEDGPITTVSVREGPPRDGRLNRGIYNNGKSDGNLIVDYRTMSLAALVPALLAERLERGFVIGFGTGVTTGELAALEWIREVDVAEISQGVIHAAPLFDEGNLAASQNPKVTINRGDAYRALLRSEGRYDVIVSEPSNPWVTGVEMLYSVEFLETARDRLATGGVYAQWFHLYETDLATVELVLRTFTSVFPHVSVWFTYGPDLLLLGFDRSERALDVSALQARFERSDFAAGFSRVGIESVPALLAHELLPLGTLRAAKLEGPLHTLRHPILSDRAARAFFLGDTAPLLKFAHRQSARVARTNSLLRRFVGTQEPTLPESVLESVARETCVGLRGFECTTLLASWLHDDPESERLAILLEELRKELPISALPETEVLKQLGVLFGRAPLRKLDGPDSLARANRVSAMFRLYYHHAVPFERGTLRAVWNQCLDFRCDEARRQLEQEVGPLGR
jgi:spermidine synthase